MIDTYGRKIDYIRISITDRCNLRCKYCVPAQGVKMGHMDELLSYEEIVRLCSIFAKEGVAKIKLTGGEPLVRRDVELLAEKINSIEGIEQVTLTTNGVLLAEKAKALYDAGIRNVNVSLDTLDSELYKRITGVDCLDEVLRGINTALEMGFNVKINTVLGEYAGSVGAKYFDVLGLARDKAIDVRFIELMPIGQGKEYPTVSAETIKLEIENQYGRLIQDTRQKGNGPAEYYRIPSFEGTVGFIHPIHGKFCDKCNRLRLTSTGMLKACLCYDTGVMLRESLRDGSSDELIAQKIMECVRMKPQEHHFEQREQISEIKDMSMIGG